MIERDIPYIETHLNVALSLYIQRSNCLEQKYVEVSVQLSIERRLLVHLHVLSQCIDLDESEPKDDADLFVYVSRRLLSPVKEHQEQITLFSKQILTQFQYPVGLVDAFILFYNQNINKLLGDLFGNNKNIRSTIIKIWHYRNRNIPIGLLNQSELQHQDTDLQEAVLRYQAEQDTVSIELFQNYYRSLINNVQNKNLTADVLHAALWGGMLRQDSEMIVAIRRAIELESNDDNREIFLRLAAINGSTEFLPIFNSVAENKPEFGSYLISLLGKSESIKILFSMLQNPRISILIVPAWRLITGQNLKLIPRISLVDENQGQSDKSNIDELEDIPLIADIKTAKLWAMKNVSQWNSDKRYIHGVECNLRNLQELSYQLSGKIGEDINDLLSLYSTSPLNLKLNNWVSDRLKILDKIKISNNNSTISDYK
jgi:hypothetical protein